MTQPSYVTFKGVDNYNDVQLMTELENNLKYYLDWAFLCIGGWTDVSYTGYTDSYIGSPATLNWIKEESYTSGQVWQAAKKDWVWEQGINYGSNSGNPINITGVYVNTGVVSTGYYINYPLGRVVLTNPVSTGSTVKLDYSYRNVQVYKADDADWWKNIQFNSISSNSQFTQDPRTGDWSIGSYHRIQLPAIIIETVPRSYSRGYELGNGSLIVEQDVLFHILADNRVTRNNLTSILVVQNDKTIWLFDTNAIASGRVFPIDYRGTKVNNAVYPDLVSEASGYRYKKCTFTKTTTSEVESLHPSLYEAIVRSTLEVVFGNI
jgi:hypothetical protein